MQARDTVGAGGVSKVMIIFPKNSYQKDEWDIDEDTLHLIVSSCVCVRVRRRDKSKKTTKNKVTGETVGCRYECESSNP